MEFLKDKKLDVILMGRVTIDFNPSVDGYYKRLSEVETFHKYVGGSPANIAIGLARLGRKAGFQGMVSKDAFGDYVINTLKREGVDTSCVFRCKNGETLGLAFTEILSKEESSILMYRTGAADLSFSPGNVKEAYIASAKAILISGTMLSAPPSREAAFKAVALAKKHHVRVVFDLDYRPQNWNGKDEITAYYSLLAMQADILLGSREEVTLAERFAIPGVEEDRQSAAFWFQKGVSILIIKHGKDGSNAFFSEGGSYRVKPFPARLLKSFGGGDGYAAAFLAAMLNGKTEEEALSLGSACAAMLVAGKSCSEDMPSMEDLMAFEEEAVSQYGKMVAPL